MVDNDECDPMIMFVIVIHFDNNQLIMIIGEYVIILRVHHFQFLLGMIIINNHLRILRLPVV